MFTREPLTVLTESYIRASDEKTRKITRNFAKNDFSLAPKERDEFQPNRSTPTELQSRLDSGSIKHLVPPGRGPEFLRVILAKKRGGCNCQKLQPEGVLGSRGCLARDEFRFGTLVRNAKVNPEQLTGKNLAARK